MSKMVRRDTAQAGLSAARIRKIEYRSNVRVRGDRVQFVKFVKFVKYL